MSETLELRPYPGLNPAPEGVWLGWWWLVATLLIGAVVYVWYRRSRRACLPTPDMLLTAALAATNDASTNLAKRYVQIHQAFRAFLAWRYDPRWTAVTGQAWEGSQRTSLPPEVIPETRDRLRVYWALGDFVQFGQGSVTEQDLAGYAELIGNQFLEVSAEKAGKSESKYTAR